MQTSVYWKKKQKRKILSPKFYQRRKSICRCSEWYQHPKKKFENI